MAFLVQGYYVNNEYEAKEMNENPPEHVDINQMVRNILHDSPRVTRFDINWNGDHQPGGEGMETGENMDSRDGLVSEMMDDGAALQAAAASGNGGGMHALGMMGGGGGGAMDMAA
eukprot:SAG22_NODE_1348_length_4662_cov_2.722113_3_plen_115_part_00